MSLRVPAILGLVGLIAVNSCSSDGETSRSGGGGSPSTGGTANGGATSTGGASRTGGTANGSGGTAPGGASASGGADNSGGDSPDASAGGVSTGGARPGTGGSGAGGAGTGGAGSGGAANAGGALVDIDAGLSCGSSQDRIQQTARSASGAVRLTLARCMGSICGGGCSVGEVYVAIRFDSYDDEAKGDDIEYTSTHHNWNDSLTASLPGGRTLKWRVEPDLDSPVFEIVPYVTVSAAGGAVLLPETRLRYDATK